MNFLDNLPYPMTEWWFIPASLLCLLLIPLLFGTLIIITIIRNRSGGRSEPRDPYS